MCILWIQKLKHRKGDVPQVSSSQPFDTLKNHRGRGRVLGNGGHQSGFTGLEMKTETFKSAIVEDEWVLPCCGSL